MMHFTFADQTRTLILQNFFVVPLFYPLNFRSNFSEINFPENHFHESTVAFPKLP